MKVLIWATVIVAVTCARINHQTQNQNNVDSPPEDFGPWKQGRLYTYAVETHTVASLHEGSSSGSTTKAQFLVFAKSPRHLQAMMVNPEHAQVHHDLKDKESLPQDLKYEPVKELEQPFEIYMNINRVEYLRFPQSLSIQNENLLKGLISTLQSSISPYRAKHGREDNYDIKTHQGQFRKMETDVTGDCETLYVISPLSTQKKINEINSNFKDDPAVEITMSKDYGKCNHRVAYHFGVPSDAEWTGTAHKYSESQFMKRSTNSRLITGPNGIYKAETTSTVHVSPLMYGKQKAEVYSKVSFYLLSIKDNAQPKWQIPENMRKAENLLYTLRDKYVEIDTRSSSSEESSNRSEGSSEEKSQEQHQSTRARREASGSQESNVANQYRRYLKERTSSSASSSSSESNESGYANDDMPNDHDAVYSSFYMTSQGQDEAKNNPMFAQKLAQEIAQQIQNPNAMPKADTLAKFNILVRIVSAMNREQLAQTSRSIENAKTSNNAIKIDIWMVYRDAVAQAGTIPAFQQIKTWILSKKIQNEEAAQVVATLASTLRYPTKDVMKQFFELSSIPEVREQMYLNSTVLVSATRLINMAYVNEKVAKSRYPTQMYGRLTAEKDGFIKGILSRLQNEMDEAIARGDSHRAQVMIKAIGNLADEGTLQAYAPYLEGKIPARTYLRRFMVDNLDLLAYQKDHATRSALYSLLKNTAEPTEVRVAAVLNIFMGHPSSAMMQAMAHMTNNDPSYQVRAVIKSSIQTAAQLTDPKLSKLARSAQEVLEILSKENYSAFYSRKQYYDYYNADQEMSLDAMLSYIASEDGMLAKFARLAWRQNSQEWNNMNSISAAFSDPRQSIDRLKAQLYKTFNQHEKMPQEQANLKYSADWVAERLGYKRDEKKPSQGAFTIDLANQQRFFTYDEDDIQSLPRYLKKALKEIAEGYDYHYTKVFNRDQVSVMFPLTSGMPFIFNYKAPILVHVQGKAKANLALDGQNPSDIQNEVQFTYAKNIEGSVGFYDTLSHQHASAGIVSKTQIYIPIKAQIQVRKGEATIQVHALRPEEETTILHSSLWPYTSIQKKNSITTVAHEPSTKVIERQVKTSSVNAKFGVPQTGMQFQLNGYSYSKDHRSAFAMFKPYDIVSAVVLGTNQRDMALSHFNLKYVGKQSPNKRLTVKINYDETLNRAQDKPLLRDAPVPEQKDTLPSSDERRQEMLTRVSSGIKSSRAQVLDLSASFEGAETVQYVLTAAIGRSEVDPNIQYAVFAAKNGAKSVNFQSNAHGLLTRAQTTAMNLADALKQSFKTTFNADIKLGEKSGNIHIDGSLKRSPNNVEYTEKTPMTRDCLKQMKEESYYQPACQTAIQAAHVSDQLKVAINYKDMSANIQNMLFQAYNYARGWAYEYVKENIQKRSQEGKLEMEAQLSAHKTLDINLRTHIGEIRVESIPVPRATYAALTMYSPLNSFELLGNYYLNQQYLPYCSVEPNQIKTFSNRSYHYYPMTKAWHVVMLDDGKYGDKLVVLANRPNEKQQEVYISYQSQMGESFEVRLKPEKSQSSDKASVEVQTKLKQVSTGALNKYSWSHNQTAVAYYALPDGVLVVNIDNDKVRALYDGQRLVIYANGYRHSTRGMCGRMTAEPNDDYITPYGYVNDGFEYAASYALNQKHKVPETDLLQKQAKMHAYQPERQYTSIVHSDKYWSQYKQEKHESSTKQSSSSEKLFRVRSYKREVGECQLHEQVQYFDHRTEICITLQPIPSCSSQCHGENYSKRSVRVACRPNQDQEFQKYREQIRQGHNPQVPENGEDVMWRFRIPAICRK